MTTQLDVFAEALGMTKQEVLEWNEYSQELEKKARARRGGNPLNTADAVRMSMDMARRGE